MYVRESKIIVTYEVECNFTLRNLPWRHGVSPTYYIHILTAKNLT